MNKKGTYHATIAFKYNQEITIELLTSQHRLPCSHLQTSGTNHTHHSTSLTIYMREPYQHRFEWLLGPSSEQLPVCKHSKYQHCSQDRTTHLDEIIPVFKAHIVELYRQGLAL